MGKKKHAAVTLNKKEKDCLISYLAEYCIWFSGIVSKEAPESEDDGKYMIDELQDCWNLRNSILDNAEGAKLSASEAHTAFYALDCMLDVARANPDFDNIWYFKTLADIYDQCSPFMTAQAVANFEGE